ncbi:MAG TPA: hypothetical protein VKT82_06885 [Ktedonobacterales bacterium]|nr:hypothetical protein [Ktedonobacterales bacterium]
MPVGVVAVPTGSRCVVAQRLPVVNGEWVRLADPRKNHYWLR